MIKEFCDICGREFIDEKDKRHYVTIANTCLYNPWYKSKDDMIESFTVCKECAYGVLDSIKTRRRHI